MLQSWKLRQRDVSLVPLEAQLGLMGLERTLYLNDSRRKAFKKSWTPGASREPRGDDEPLGGHGHHKILELMLQQSSCLAQGDGSGCRLISIGGAPGRGDGALMYHRPLLDVHAFSTPTIKAQKRSDTEISLPEALVL